MPELRAASSARLQGPTAACSSETSLPGVSPKPPGSRKSRCMSITISARGPGRISAGRARRPGAGWSVLAFLSAGGPARPRRRRETEIFADFDWASVEAEILTRIKACEAALGANDVDRLVGFFWDDPRAVRLSPGGALCGRDQIAGFRKGRDVSDIARELSEMRITAFSADFGTATCEYRRLGSGRRAAQSQIRMRRPEGWPIVSAHVSLDARPAGGALSLSGVPASGGGSPARVREPGSGERYARSDLHGARELRWPWGRRTVQQVYAAHSAPRLRSIVLLSNAMISAIRWVFCRGERHAPSLHPHDDPERRARASSAP